MSASPTIVGVATGTPDGGVAVVRLSGGAAVAIASPIAGEPPPPRVLARRRLDLSRGGRGGPSSPGEDALVVVMPGPRSFTGEDVVELHVHGGARNVREIVDRLIDAGAAPAGPGEFTRRAFERGRLDLEQAEGIAALIGARTQAAVEQARRLIAGELGERVRALVESLAELRAEVEANLDFPDDVQPGDLERWRAEIVEIKREVDAWLRRFEAGRRAREAARVVLAGPPNAGKSSLFNALLGRDRALVAAEPGTTRDFVEAEIEVGGRVMVLVDTAGVRDAVPGSVEAAGIVRAHQQIAGADLVLWIEAADAPTIEVPSAIRSLRRIDVESKRDLGIGREAALGVSVTAGSGLGELREAMARHLEGGDEDEPWIGLHRHRERASEAAEALTEALTEVDDGAALELLAFHLGVGERRLAEITGRSALGPIGEDVLARIFSRFCIGK
ncbi:MAG: tRNA modification GTPase [Nannocystaceae bacterium]